MASVKSVKVSASTLIETIISMVIILAIFGIVTTFLVQISSKSSWEAKIIPEQMLLQYEHETEFNHTYFDEMIRYNSFLIRRETINTGYVVNVIKVRFSIYDENNKLLTFHKRIFRIN